MQLIFYCGLRHGIERDAILNHSIWCDGQEVLSEMRVADEGANGVLREVAAIYGADGALKLILTLSLPPSAGQSRAASAELARTAKGRVTYSVF